MSALPPGWKTSADGVKVQTRAGRQSFWDNEYTEDYKEDGTVHVPTKESIKAYEANMPAFDMTQEVDFGGGRMSTADIQKVAKAKGWADPMAFSTDMLEGVTQDRAGDGGMADFGSAQFKDPASRGIDGSKRNQNKVKVNYKTNEDGTQEIAGYIVNAGAVKGTKNHTALLYEYDKYGRFKGANTDMEERGLEGAAPIVAMAGMALGFAPGGFSSIGAGVNSTLGLGLAPGWNAALGGATFGGASAAITGQDPIKGAVMGAITPAVKMINPGTGLLGLSGNAAMAANLGIGTGIKAAVSGKKPSPINTAISLAAGWR